MQTATETVEEEAPTSTPPPPTPTEIPTNHPTPSTSHLSLNPTLSSFSIPSIFSESSPTSTTTSVPAPTTTSPPTTAELTQNLTKLLTTYYPFALTTTPPRTPNPSFWGTLKNRHLLSIGTDRARNHLHHPTYMFPDQLYDDVRSLLAELLPILSHPATASDPSALHSLMVAPLANRFALTTEQLYRQGEGASIALKLHTPPNKLKVRLTNLDFTYGPYPAPADYIAQRWVDMLTLMIPQEDARFMSAQRQKEVMKNAMDDGCFIRATVKVEGDLELILRSPPNSSSPSSSSDDALPEPPSPSSLPPPAQTSLTTTSTDTSLATPHESFIPLLRDRRRSFTLQLVSPHFTPWDELFVLDENNEWQVAWRWRISDVDGLMEGEKREEYRRQGKVAIDYSKNLY
ncbi:hypothetical protein HDV00_002778 [Rhizophlyctis rosea]|nr:hypothetical protein HDV00_002778 [Rhizophlyctis rosea]